MPTSRTASSGRGVAGSKRKAESLEDQIVHLAISGALDEAAGNAIRSQLARGIAVTFKKGDRIIKHYADGHEEVVGTVPRATYTVPAGVAIIKRK
jgi:hypothetical protein